MTVGLTVIKRQDRREPRQVKDCINQKSRCIPPARYGREGRGGRVGSGGRNGLGWGFGRRLRCVETRGDRLG